MRQKRAKKTKVEIHPKTDPRRWGPGRGSINFARWFKSLTWQEENIVRMWEHPANRQIALYIHPDFDPVREELDTPNFAHFFGLPKQRATPSDFLYIWNDEEDCDCYDETERGH